jgi:transcriptional regulator with XRE-family HTH domain
MKSADERSTTTNLKLRMPSSEGNSRLLGERLRRLRQQQGLTLRGLAKKVGVTATALHAWENGRRNPKLEHLQAFANAFKLTRAELLGDVEGGTELDPLTIAAGDHSQLTEVIGLCKQRIAAAAGISTDRVRIIIEV